MGATILKDSCLLRVYFIASLTAMRERQHSDVQNSPVKRSRVALDTRLYDASLLRDEVAFEIAIGDLESTLAQTPSAECIVEQLASVPHLLECMISSEYTASLHHDVWLLTYLANSGRR